ncbi:MAG: DUF2933 domain-containing protein [Gammaproteobacteria bacterium]|jgi:hypothetical protein|nr:DUF2933 domain-containing protein [Gammaproteobacteria bacterium]
MDNPDNPQKKESFIFSKGTVIACVVLAVTGFLILTGHSAHLLGILPWLLILACPLMHIFMHGGHHHGGKDDGEGMHDHHHMLDKENNKDDSK